MKKETKEKMPSEIIREMAQKIHEAGIDPCFNGNVPDIGDWISAIIQYLDENLCPKN